MHPPYASRILFKVDARRKEPLLEVLVAQEPERRAHGELSFSLAVADSARHVCYVTLEWSSFELACKFFDSEASHLLVAKWPVVEVLEAAVLKDITAEYLAYRGSKQSPKELK